MAKYRKKPKVIDAFQWTGDVDAMEKWLDEMGGNPGEILIDNNDGTDEVRIQTLEGEMVGPLMWWIIRGIKGEFYPCKPDIFEESYEKVEAETP